MNGIYVQKDVEKAKMIFLDGQKLMIQARCTFLLIFWKKKTDEKESIEYYKLAAKLGHINSQIHYASLISKK